jgi:hypothetical protein
LNWICSVKRSGAREELKEEKEREEERGGKWRREGGEIDVREGNNDERRNITTENPTRQQQEGERERQREMRTYRKA